jgi:hypothetical protein
MARIYTKRSLGPRILGHDEIDAAVHASQPTTLDRHGGGRLRFYARVAIFNRTFSSSAVVSAVNCRSLPVSSGT